MFDIKQPAGRADLLLQSITDYAIYMLDPSGIVVSWNIGAERLKGYIADEIIGSHFSRFYTESDLESGTPRLALDSARKTGRFEAEGWRVRKDGSQFWANVVIDSIHDDAGDLIGFAKITRDLSERRAAMEALRQSEERFRLLVQSVTDYAIYMLDIDGNVSSWNAGAQRFKGYREEEIIGENFAKFYPPEDRAAGAPVRALATAREQGRFEAEGWRLRKDGTRFWAGVVIDPIHDPDGRLRGYTKITRDLTERKQAQEALRKSQEQVFQAQKLESIGKLTGGVAHDFNNILAAILGSLGLAQRRMAAGEDITRFIDNAIIAAERGATLTQRMLAFARKQQLKIEAFDMCVSIEEMAELIRRTIGPDIEIRTEFGKNLPLVLADKAQLDSAVMNLAVNARDAMPDGGEIVLAAREAELADQFGRFVCLSVSDTGEGMDASTLAKAAEPFFTTKGVGKGTGLGLSMVHGMVEQCGGRLVVKSRQGIGTRVEVWLPVAEQVEAKPTECSDEVVACTNCLKILAVDDDPIVLLNTCTTLSDMGHEVRHARSGEQALAYLSKEPVDLLITDYAMPSMNGGELVDIALQSQPDLKVLIVSGYAEVPEGKVFEWPWLSKPFGDAELLSAISRATA